MGGRSRNINILGLTLMIRIKIERLIINTTLSYQAVSGL